MTSSKFQADCQGDSYLCISWDLSSGNHPCKCTCNHQEDSHKILTSPDHTVDLDCTHSHLMNREAQLGERWVHFSLFRLFTVDNSLHNRDLHQMVFLTQMNIYLR